MRTSENSIIRKFNFGELPFHALEWIGLPTPPGTRSMPFVTPKITPLSDVPIRTIFYTAFAVLRRKGSS
jgi:hypothetical protein